MPTLEFIAEIKRLKAEIDEAVNMLLYCNPVPAKKTQYEALMDKYRGNVMIPKILHEASRQYRHNSSDELVSGFDKDETIKIVTGLQAEIDRLKENLRIAENEVSDLRDYANLCNKKFKGIEYIVNTHKRGK